VPSSRYDSFRDGHCKLKRKYGKERDGDDSTDLFRLLRYGRRKGEEDTPLTVGIAFSLDRCLLMGDPKRCYKRHPEEMKAKTKEEKNHRMRERISAEMRRYFGPDTKRVNHALKVAQYAEEILKIEGGHPLVVFGAAYLHDIGIKEAEEKYGSGSVEDQEKMGPDIARDILNRLNVQRGIVEEICDIIGHHHHPRKTETLNFQILYEADWLVNMEENGLFQKPGEKEEIIGKVFKTVTGKKLAKEIFSQV